MTDRCVWCEYFDAGGLHIVELARDSGASLEGDCLNSASDRFQTDAQDTCPVFLRDSGVESDD